MVCSKKYTNVNVIGLNLAETEWLNLLIWYFINLKKANVVQSKLESVHCYFHNPKH